MEKGFQVQDGAAASEFMLEIGGDDQGLVGLSSLWDSPPRASFTAVSDNDQTLGGLFSLSMPWQQIWQSGGAIIHASE